MSGKQKQMLKGKKIIRAIPKRLKFNARNVVVHCGTSLLWGRGRMGGQTGDLWWGK